MLQTNVGKEEAKHMDNTLIRYGNVTSINIENTRNYTYT